jgi:hypothetical protein
MSSEWVAVNHQKDLFLSLTFSVKGAWSHCPDCCHRPEDEMFEGPINRRYNS